MVYLHDLIVSSTSDEMKVYRSFGAPQVITVRLPTVLRIETTETRSISSRALTARSELPVQSVSEGLKSTWELFKWCSVIWQERPRHVGDCYPSNRKIGYLALVK